MMEEPTSTQNTVQTEFNSNIACLIRIDTLLRRCANDAFTEDIDAYFRDLRNLRKEARVKMKHKQLKGKCISDCPRCQCDNEFDSVQILYTMYSQGFRKDFNLKKDLLCALDKYELLLRDFMDMKGMLLSENRHQGL